MLEFKRTTNRNNNDWLKRFDCDENKRKWIQNIALWYVRGSFGGYIGT